MGRGYEQAIQGKGNTNGSQMFEQIFKLTYKKNANKDHIFTFTLAKICLITILSKVVGKWALQVFLVQL